jgi:hypothetical protein
MNPSKRLSQCVHVRNIATKRSKSIDSILSVRESSGRIAPTTSSNLEYNHNDIWLIQCMFRAMVDIGVVTNRDDDSSFSMCIGRAVARSMWLFHCRDNNHDDQSQFTSSSHVLRFTTSTTTNGHVLQQHRAQVIQHVRGLHYSDTKYISDIRMSNITNDRNQSTYLSSDTIEIGANTVGTVVIIVACVLVVILFVWLGYCACWFGFDGYVT